MGESKKLKIYQFLHEDNTVDWLIAESKKEAVDKYLSTTGINSVELNEIEITRLPKNKWKSKTIRGEATEEGDIDFNTWVTHYDSLNIDFVSTEFY